MRSSRDLKITITLALLVFVVMVYLSGTDPKQIRSAISTTVTLTVLMRLIYLKWIWKLLPQWAHGVPKLEGNWVGTYESTGNERTPADRLTGEATLSISQPDLFTVKVKRGSAESGSISMGEQLSVDEHGTAHLSYIYRSEPNAIVRDRSPISYGTARLRTGVIQSLELSGDYWTDQKTTGTLKFKKQKKHRR